MSEPIAVGRVVWLGINGYSVTMLDFNCGGPAGGHNSGNRRSLNGSDSEYLGTSKLKKGDSFFNFNTWTALSREEVNDIEEKLHLPVPNGCLLENIIVSGVPQFSNLNPTTRLVFPQRISNSDRTQAILAIWEKSKTVGDRLEQHHRKPGLRADFVAVAPNSSGVTGFVLAAGQINVGDEVLVFPPVR